MNATVCSLSFAVQKLLGIYIALLLVYALASWLPGIRGRWTEYLAMVIEPVLLPLRRILPPLGGLDLSFLVLIIGIQFLQSAIVPRMCFFS